MVKRRISKRYIILLFDFLFGRLAEAGIFLDKIVTDSSLFKVIFPLIAIWTKVTILIKQNSVGYCITSGNYRYSSLRTQTPLTNIPCYLTISSFLAHRQSYPLISSFISHFIAPIVPYDYSNIKCAIQYGLIHT